MEAVCTVLWALWLWRQKASILIQGLPLISSLFSRKTLEFPSNNFPLSFLFMLNFDNFFSFFPNPLIPFVAMTYLLLQPFTEFLISITEFFTLRSSILFLLKSACCLTTLFRLFSTYLNILNTWFHIVILMILISEIIKDLILLHVISFGSCS